MAVQKNGPHFWMMDWQELSMGEQTSFGGLQARNEELPIESLAKFGAQLKLPPKRFS